MSVMPILFLVVALQAPPPPAAESIDRDFLIGHWSLLEDCSLTASFRADGTALISGEAKVFQWSLADSVLTTVEREAGTERVNVRRRGDRLEIARDSGEAMQFYRCASEARSPSRSGANDR